MNGREHNKTLIKPAIWLPTIRAGTGSDVFTERLCEGLNAKGIRAGITWLPHRAEYASCSVMPLKRPDWATVAHVNSWMPGRLVPRGLPVVVTVHHLVHDPAYSPYRSRAQALYHEVMIRRREREAIESAAAVTTVSDYVRGTVEQFASRKEVEVVPNWVNSGVFTPNALYARDPSARFRLLIVGSRTKRKGFDLLPQFAASLGPGSEIRYVGGSPGKRRISIPGVIDLGRLSESDLVREYQQCDAVASLSRYEGFGYTALEAMACAKPFVGFDTSGLAEVADQTCGLLSRTGDVEGLAASIRRLASDPVLAAAMGECGRRRAQAEFACDSSIDAYVEIYTSILAKRRGNK